MNTPSQNNLIRQYLLGRKLPWDILLEVEDHVRVQVQDMEISEYLTFEDAFAKVQQTWEKDLRVDRLALTTYDEFLSTPFVRKIYWQKRKKTIVKATLFAVLILLSFFILARLEEKMFTKIFIALITINVAVPIVYYFRYFRIFRFTDKFSNKVSIFQRELMVWIFILNSFNFIWISKQTLPDFYRLLNFQKTEDPLYAGFLLMFTLFWGGMACYCFLFYRKFVKSVQYVKPQLADL
ncbi:TPA: hypothetical protein ACG0AO_002670 [Elizabethkingia meningoseptica]